MRKGVYYIRGEMMELVDAHTTLCNRMATFPVGVESIDSGTDTGTLCVWVDDVEKLASAVGERLVDTDTEIGFHTYGAWWYAPKEVEDDSE